MVLTDSDNFQHKIIYGPSLRCTAGGHVMHHLKAGLRLYIRPLYGHKGVRASMKYARVLLIRTTASSGRQFVQGLNAPGVPVVSSRMVHAALLGVNPCVIRLVSSRGDWFGRP